jgi:hypothetical protein
MKNKRKDKVRVRTNQKSWRVRQIEKDKKILTVWISKKEMETLKKLQKHFEEPNRSSLISRMIKEFQAKPAVKMDSSS